MRFRLILATALLALCGSAQANIFQAMKIMKNNTPPKQAFDERAAPPRPDYRQRASWAALPDMRDAADGAPLGVRPGDQARAAVDVFFIYPTVFFSKTQWNADPRDATYRRQVDDGPLRGQATIFNGCCRVYAPHYRQMTLGGYVKWSANSEKAVGLAYEDIARAFEQYLDIYNQGRPFIIAGHSQGSRIARRLIEERIDGRPVARRMVAAYLVGHWIESEWFGRLRDFRPCVRADDTRCILTWSSFEEGRNATLQRLTLGRTSNYPPEKIRRPYTCINPLNWSAGTEAAPRSANLGTWIHGSGSSPRAMDMGALGARCSDGALYVSKLGKPYADLVIPFGNYHNLDYSVAYMNIRENALTRATAFLRQPR